MSLLFRRAFLPFPSPSERHRSYFWGFFTSTNQTMSRNQIDLLPSINRQLRVGKDGITLADAWKHAKCQRDTNRTNSSTDNRLSTGHGYWHPEKCICLPRHLCTGPYFIYWTYGLTHIAWHVQYSQTWKLDTTWKVWRSRKPPVSGVSTFSSRM